MSCATVLRYICCIQATQAVTPPIAIPKEWFPMQPVVARISIIAAVSALMMAPALPGGVFGAGPAFAKNENSEAKSDSGADRGGKPESEPAAEPRGNGNSGNGNSGNGNSAGGKPEGAALATAAAAALLAAANGRTLSPEALAFLRAQLALEPVLPEPVTY